MRPTPLPPFNSLRPSYKSTPCEKYTPRARPEQSNVNRRPPTSIRDLPRNRMAARASASCRWVPTAMVQQARPRVSLTGTIPSFCSYTPMSPSSVSGHSLLEESAVAHAWSVAASRTAKRLRVIVGSAPRDVITAGKYTDRHPFGKISPDYSRTLLLFTRCIQAEQRVSGTPRSRRPLGSEACLVDSYEGGTPPS